MNYCDPPPADAQTACVRVPTTGIRHPTHNNYEYPSSPFSCLNRACVLQRQVFDTVSKSLVMELKGHEDAVQSVLFSPADDSLISTSSDCTFRLWS